MDSALYRRYRPQTFQEVIGQEHVTEPLMAALRSGRISHAFLFSGPRGCGKTSSARILARCLNCEQGPTDVPCGECDSCLELGLGGRGSLDVVEIDAASHNGVDDARDLRERATANPTRDRYKIFILDEAHMVTPQGFNALLKIVEEPPPHVKFIFATTEPDKVIGTIRSRTHHYPFRLVPPEKMTAFLGSLCAKEEIKVEDGVLPLVVRAGAGSVRDSESVLDQLMAGADEEGIKYDAAVALLGYTPAALLDEAVAAFAADDGASVFSVIDRVIENGQDPRRFAEDLLERLRDLIVIAAAGDKAEVVLHSLPADQLARMRETAAAFGLPALSRAGDLVNEGLAAMTGATSPRLQLELLCARVLVPSPAAGVGAADGGMMASPGGYGTPAQQPPRGVGPAQGPGSGTPAGDGVRRVGGAGHGGRDSAGDAGPGPSSPGSGSRAEGGRAPESEPAAGPGRVPPAASAAPHGTSHQRSAASSAPARLEPVGGGPAGSGASSGDPAGAGATGSGATGAPGSATGEVPDGQGGASSAGSAGGPAGPGGSAGGTGATLTPEAIAANWDRLLEELSRLRKATWALVRDNAQVHSVEGDALVLAFSAPPLATLFQNGGHAATVAEAAAKVLGVPLRVTATSGQGPGPGSGPSRPQPLVSRPSGTPAVHASAGSAGAGTTAAGDRTTDTAGAANAADWSEPGGPGPANAGTDPAAAGSTAAGHAGGGTETASGATRGRAAASSAAQDDSAGQRAPEDSDSTPANVVPLPVNRAGQDDLVPEPPPTPLPEGSGPPDLKVVPGGPEAGGPGTRSASPSGRGHGAPVAGAREPKRRGGAGSDSGVPTPDDPTAAGHASAPVLSPVPSAPGARTPAGPPLADDEDDIPSDDDLVVDDGTEAGASVVEKLLGGKIIEETTTDSPE